MLAHRSSGQTDSALMFLDPPCPFTLARKRSVIASPLGTAPLRNDCRVQHPGAPVKRRFFRPYFVVVVVQDGAFMAME